MKKFLKLSFLWNVVRYFGLPLILYIYPFSFVMAEYRAYELEIFDHMTQRKEIRTTTFSPTDYVLTHGGPRRISIIIRASWMCWGNTSNYKKICQQPVPISPRFQVGDRVQIVLQKHITDKWEGTVENVFYRPDLRSNVYGVRFPERRNLYTRYYEANLQLANKKPSQEQ